MPGEKCFRENGCHIYQWDLREVFRTLLCSYAGSWILLNTATTAPRGWLKRGYQFVSQELDGERIMGILENRLRAVNYVCSNENFQDGWENIHLNQGSANDRL